MVTYFMRWFFMLTVLLCGGAHAQMMQSIVSGKSASGTSSYTGPGDVVSGASAFYSCAQGYNNAVAAPGTTKACNLRRASDNTTADFVILNNGNFDTASAASFAGTDATASCTISGTTATCTGASSTPHVNDPVSGSGVAVSCRATAVGTFTSGSGTATVSDMFGASCGTIGVAETMTFHVALFVTEAYDQTGNGSHCIEATIGNQMQLLLLGANSNPTMIPNGSQFCEVTATVSVPQPWTVVGVASTASLAANVWLAAKASTWAVGFASPSNIAAFAGTLTGVGGASVNTLYALQYVGNGSSSVFVKDGASSTGQIFGANAIANPYNIASDSGAGSPLTGLIGNVLIYPVGLNSTQDGNMHTNLSAFWGTP